MKIRTLIFLVSVLLQVLPTSPCFLCLVLGSAYKCPEPPSCCESGYYALDECGCCKKCAKAELQPCGGPSDATGRCAQGLQCLKTCLSCKTVGDRGQPCVFPFKYINQTYNTCITKDSDSGQPWCATSVDQTGHVIDFAWGDCSQGCPGTSLECDVKYFKIKEGTCIDKTVPGAVPNWFGAPAVHLDEPTEILFPAPVCLSKVNQRVYKNTCRCDNSVTGVSYDINGVQRGNCTGVDVDDEDNLDQIWCFLQNIRDPQDPTSGCYRDTTWSPKDARFWSSEACDQENQINSFIVPEPEKDSSIQWRPIEKPETFISGEAFFENVQKESDSFTTRRSTFNFPTTTTRRPTFNFPTTRRSFDLPTTRSSFNFASRQEGSFTTNFVNTPRSLSRPSSFQTADRDRSPIQSSQDRSSFQPSFKATSRDRSSFDKDSRDSSSSFAFNSFN